MSKRIVIAGTHSGVGKTTITGAILKLLKNSGLTVAPFKVGPDYIDPKFHSFITGNESFNLDSWMLDADTVKQLFIKNSSKSGISVIEGVMGLYDGSGTGTTGSTADVSKILKAPVILIADAGGISTSIAAMISGYINYDRDVNIRGVILNNVSGEKHYNLLKEIIERDTDIECAGYLKTNKSYTLNSRHLGLIPVEELDDLNKKIDILAAEASGTIDLEKIMAIASECIDIKKPATTPTINKTGSGLTIGIAKDRAFNFYYRDNLNLMEESGIKLVEFSPLKDKKLPSGIDGLYLGGGFPEIFAEELSDNLKIKSEIKKKALGGLPVYAECGGLMYLSSGIIDMENNIHEMIDFFQCKVEMRKKLQRFGYININYDGVTVRGHEFHHSSIVDRQETDYTFKYKIEKPNKGLTWECGLSKKNVLAGYAHIHFYSNLKFFEKIINLFKRRQSDKEPGEH